MPESRYDYRRVSVEAQINTLKRLAEISPDHNLKIGFTFTEGKGRVIAAVDGKLLSFVEFTMFDDSLELAVTNVIEYYYSQFAGYCTVDSFAMKGRDYQMLMDIGKISPNGVMQLAFRVTSPLGAKESHIVPSRCLIAQAQIDYVTELINAGSVEFSDKATLWEGQTNLIESSLDATDELKPALYLVLKP